MHSGHPIFEWKPGSLVVDVNNNDDNEDSEYDPHENENWDTSDDESGDDNSDDDSDDSDNDDLMITKMMMTIRSQVTIKTIRTVMILGAYKSTLI